LVVASQAIWQAYTSGQVIVAPWQTWLPPHSTWQANPCGQATGFILHWAMQVIVHTPPAQPPLHTAGHAPPSAVGALPQPPEEEEVLEDDALEEDVLEEDVLEEDAPEEDEVEEELLDAPPAPASPVSGSSWMPKTWAHAGAASTASTAAGAMAVRSERIRGPPSGARPRRAQRTAGGGSGPRPPAAMGGSPLGSGRVDSGAGPAS
jgi:hypothetical protein